MSELRYDPATNDWVIFAPGRTSRPHDVASAPPARASASDDRSRCPFCPGNEAATPPEIYAVRDGGEPDDPNWILRVTPNKFPALRDERDPARRQDGPLFRRMAGDGRHEVFVESPDHDRFLGEQSVSRISLLLSTIQLRYNAAMSDDRIQSVVVFKNHGRTAGTSIAHPHCQLIALPVVPQMIRRRFDVATNYFDATGQNLILEMAMDESGAEVRLVVSNADFVAFCPYASHVPYEIWIVPRSTRHAFGFVEDGALESLARVLKSVLLKLKLCLGDPDFNMTFVAPPRGDDDKPYFLWHIQILPRINRTAGFELGSGMSINTVMPEDAARRLRETTPSPEEGGEV